MSNRPFKSQASSSRAASGGTFGGFGFASTGSTLSYLTPPPDLSSISDPNVVVAFKSLSKKDSTTKRKALEDLRAFVKSSSGEQGGIEDAIVNTWVQIYPKMAIDQSRRVRESAHLLQSEITNSIKTRMQKHLPGVIGPWLAGMFDKDRAVSNAAKTLLRSLVDTDEKFLKLLKASQKHILRYALDALNETPQTLCDERSMSADEIQEVYFGVVGSSLSLVMDLLSKLDAADILKHQEAYNTFFNDDPKKIWSLISCEDAFTRNLVARLLDVCLKKQPGIVQANLELLSKSFISEALSTTQTTSAYGLLQALDSLTEVHPDVWTSYYTAKKSPLSKLQKFIVRGSQGGPEQFWPSLRSLLEHVPNGVLPADLEKSLHFLKAVRDGINHREEPRRNSAAAWSSYFDVFTLVVKKLTDQSLQGKVFQAAIFPMFEQYLNPSLENSMWSLGENLNAIAKAYIICVSTEGDMLQASLGEEWQRLADNFIERLQTSLPEVSKSYEASQGAVIAEAHRWFSLLQEIVIVLPDDKIKTTLEQHSSRIILTALSIITSRNGKAYSAAATVEAALRVTPDVFRNPANMDALKAFLEKDLDSVIVSPSLKWLVSILHGILLLPELKSKFGSYWDATINTILHFEDADQLRGLGALIASRDVKELAVANARLQDVIYGICIRAAHGDREAWPAFEAAFTFQTIADAPARRVIEQIAQELDINSAFLKEAFAALELINDKNPDILKESDVQVMLMTKLLFLAELTDTANSSRATKLRKFITSYPESAEVDDSMHSPMISIIHQNLEAASPTTLLPKTLFKEARDIFNSTQSPELKASLFPNPLKWADALAPFLVQTPSMALGVLRPFAGGVSLVNTNSTLTSNVPRDINGYSVPLRMALYTTQLLRLAATTGITTTSIQQRLHLIDLEGLTGFLSRNLHMQYLYLLGLTYELVNDQLNLALENLLFETGSDNDAISELRQMLEDILLACSKVSRHYPIDAIYSVHPPGWSQTINLLVRKFIQAADSLTPKGYYAGKALCRFLGRFWGPTDGWTAGGGDEWLADLEIMSSNTENVFGACAILTGFGGNLVDSKAINNLCNRLVSDIAGASPSQKTLRKLVLLNSCLVVYYGDGSDESDEEDETDDTENPVIPVAQNRLVFAVKQILSWSTALTTTHSKLASEACRALYRLLPAIKDVYGPYWEGALDLCVAIWRSTDSTSISDERLPAIGMSLKLLSILQNLENANDDLSDALVNSKSAIFNGLIDLLKLNRSTDNLPLQFVDELLLGQVAKIDVDAIKDLEAFYPLLASDFRMVQSAAFIVLQKGLVSAQQLISVDAALSKKDATLADELLSLLLDAPTIDHHTDADLENFPISVRRFLLAWHLVFDAFSTASNKVRGDYATLIAKDDYIGPLLTFMFDVLGHSAAGALRLDKERFDENKIRKYDMLKATNSESSERDMQWLLVNLYYLCLKYVPGIVKDWWLHSKNRQTSIAVEAWTSKYYSTLIVQNLLEEVILWSDQQPPESEDGKPLLIKVSRNSREVFAGYEIDDDFTMQIVIRLPANYPLKIAIVEGINRVAIPEKKWSGLIMTTQGVIAFSNGSIVDGLEVWRKNIAGALKGHTECAICYSIVSSEKKLPDQQCATCRNYFHNECLHKWFKTSNANLCPLCRNPFNYAANRTPRRPRED